MKKDILWTVVVLLALITGFSVGYIFGDNRVLENSPISVFCQEDSAVGAYKTDSWNGKSGVLVLKEDGTCLYPTKSSGTWTQTGKNISIILNGDKEIYPAELVDGGIILCTTFFERVK